VRLRDLRLNARDAAPVMMAGAARRSVRATW